MKRECEMEIELESIEKLFMKINKMKRNLEKLFIENFER